MIRVLHIVSSLSVNAGIINMIMQYYREINKEEFQFDFVYFKEENDEISNRKEIIKLGGSCYYVPKLNFNNLKEVNNSFEKIYCNYKYKIVHCHEPILVNFIQSKLRKCGMQHLIVHSHSCKLSSTRWGLIRNRLMVLGMNRYCDEMLACSECAGRYLFGRKAFKKRGKVILNGVHTDQFVFDEVERSNIRNELGIADAQVILGTVGRCEDLKNQEFIIDLMSSEELRKRHIGFILVGEGPKLEYLKEKARILECDKRFFFVGAKKNVVPYLNAMDIFLFPSKSEGFGVALVEAQLCQLLSIASSNVPRETKIMASTEYLGTDKKSQKQWIDKIVSWYGVVFEDRKKRRVVRDIVDVKKCVFKLEDIYYERIRGSV